MIRGKSFLDGDSLSALQAKEKAQFIAFAPVVFKVTLALRNLGILRAVEAATGGITFDELKQRVDVSEYALRVLVDGGARAGLIRNEDDRLTLSSTGYFVLNDPMTTVNLDFINDVCYRGLDRLEASVASGRPQGLQEFGDLAHHLRGPGAVAGARPPQLVGLRPLLFGRRRFSAVLPHRVRAAARAPAGHRRQHRQVFARVLAPRSPTSTSPSWTCPDSSSWRARTSGSAGGAHPVPSRPTCSIPSVRLPGGFDAIWMSQFLDCFSEAQIVAILRQVPRRDGRRTPRSTSSRRSGIASATRPRTSSCR